MPGDDPQPVGNLNRVTFILGKRIVKEKRGGDEREQKLYKAF